MLIVRIVTIGNDNDEIFSNFEIVLLLINLYVAIAENNENMKYVQYTNKQIKIVDKKENTN